MLLLKSLASDRSVDCAPTPGGRFQPQQASLPLLSLRIRVWHPNTRIYVRLLGPCFKTGQLKPFRQHHDHAEPHRPVHHCQASRTLFSEAIGSAGKDTDAKRAVSSSIKPRVGPHVGLGPFARLSPPSLIDADPPQATKTPAGLQQRGATVRNAQRGRHPTQCKIFQGAQLVSNASFLTISSTF